MTTATQEIIKKLKRQEELEVHGAPNNTPKQQILNQSELAAKLLSEGKSLRWVNIKDPNKAISRKAEGYVRLPESEGGVTLGDELALFVIPTQLKEQRLARQEKLQQTRLTAYKTEMEQLAESTARTLKDKYGISVDSSRLFSDEGT